MAAPTRAALYFATFLVTIALLRGSASAQVTRVDKLSPSHIVMIGDIVGQQLGDAFRSRSTGAMLVNSVSEANGVWVALYASPAGNSVVVGDAQGSAQAFAVEDLVSDVAVDRAGHIHMLHPFSGGPKAGKARSVSVVDLKGNPVSYYLIPATPATVFPISSGSGLVWKLPKALVKEQTVFPLVGGNGHADVNEIRDYLHVGPLEDGGYFTFGSGSEVITLHRADGSVSGSASAPLDAAYEAIGTRVPKLPRSSEIVRVIWAASSSDGLLYVCLSGLKIGPAYIAVINAQNGALQRVIEATLPSFATAITPVNPVGAMFPAVGAVDDQLVIIDAQKAVAAIYPVR